jgi:hypothetical protein
MANEKKQKIYKCHEWFKIKQFFANKNKLTCDYKSHSHFAVVRFCNHAFDFTISVQIALHSVQLPQKSVCECDLSNIWMDRNCVRYNLILGVGHRNINMPPIYTTMAIEVCRKLVITLYSMKAVYFPWKNIFHEGGIVFHEGGIFHWKCPYSGNSMDLRWK